MKRVFYFMRSLNNLIFTKSIRALQSTYVNRLGKILVFVILFTVFTQVDTIDAFSEDNVQMIRINVIENGRVHEWEYNQPKRYEYEVEDKTIQGKRGERVVKEMLSLLQLHETSQIEVLLESMKGKFPDLEHLDIRMRNAEGKLYTWVWN